MPEFTPLKPAIPAVHILVQPAAPAALPAKRCADLAALEQMYLYYID